VAWRCLCNSCCCQRANVHNTRDAPSTTTSAALPALALAQSSRSCQSAHSASRPPPSTVTRRWRQQHCCLPLLQLHRRQQPHQQARQHIHHRGRRQTLQRRVAAAAVTRSRQYQRCGLRFPSLLWRSSYCCASCTFAAAETRRVVRLSGRVRGTTRQGRSERLDRPRGARRCTPLLPSFPSAHPPARADPIHADRIMCGLRAM
jgi:hypothetical protein